MITEQEYEDKLSRAGLSFYEEHGCCHACLYGVDDPCECKSMKEQYKKFNEELDNKK
ncbi:hypothetical protein vBVhaSMAG7_014 [Vibrio phage vB_VhaS_MAG7]|nr:hypothetical protein vBVhaSMAG7_014 [Vibrio phage vB_VhaS_MAG7]